ncbi:EAL domain-containing protein [Chungangia koreensis]|uniref:EAL domain-containing protein n=1 Tax=Chungangia koreensis TaxID=752657 RepID=A0ABV8X1X0_9LACT
MKVEDRMSLNVSRLIEERLLYCEYQPLTNLEDMTFAFEALMRSTPRINPLTVIKEARTTGLLYELDTQCIINAISEFPNSFFGKYYLFINVFPSTILHPDFRQFISSLFSKYPWIRHRVVLEINEDRAEDDLISLPIFVEKLSILKITGFQIALDDIAISKTSFERMEKFLPNFVKLDHTRSKDLAVSSDKQQLISIVLDYTKENAELILEGIETEADLKTAKELGVPLFQGYYISKPKRLSEKLFELY